MSSVQNSLRFATRACRRTWRHVGKPYGAIVDEVIVPSVAPFDIWCFPVQASAVNYAVCLRMRGTWRLTTYTPRAWLRAMSWRIIRRFATRVTQPSAIQITVISETSKPYMVSVKMDRSEEHTSELQSLRHLV